MNALRLAAAGLLAAALAAVAFLAPAFSMATPPAERPVGALVAALGLAGLAYLALAPRLAGPPLGGRAAASLFALGLLMRAIFIPTDPILEDDWRRYLWEGAAIATGVSPYDHPPAEGLAPPFPVADAAGDAARLRLLALGESEPEYPELVNHPYLTTIYPALAEAAFLLARMIAPFDLSAWRGVLFAADLSTFLILAAALGYRGLPRSRAFLYWLNPLVIFETFNAAHMEALVCPFLAAAFLFAQRKRAGAAGAMLAMAAGIKLWPVLLAPILARTFVGRPARLARFFALFAGLAALFLAPVLLSAGDAQSGLAAYASDWRRNAFLFPAIEALFTPFATDPNMFARRAGALATCVFALLLARRADDEGAHAPARALILILALFLLSPAFYPWYALALFALSPFAPSAGVLILTATLPLYHFRFAGWAEGGDVPQWAVALEFAPVLLVLMIEALRVRWFRSTALISVL